MYADANRNACSSFYYVRRPPLSGDEEEPDSGSESSVSSVDEVRKLEERKKARQRAIKMEKARRQAVRAAHRRLKELAKRPSPGKVAFVWI